MKSADLETEILEKTAADLLSVPPLIFRWVRRKLVETTLSDIEVHITPHGFEIMRLLGEAGTLHIAEIGERLHVAKAQMTQMIETLVRLELVDKKPDLVDRRISNISLNEHGKIVLKEHRRKLLRQVKESLSTLTEEELQSVSDSLRKLRNILLKK
jgi:DNA-binding MarR family transcriptional regulator